jgi:hypothetical protein
MKTNRRLRRLESFLRRGARTKAECLRVVRYQTERTFQRDLRTLESRGVRVTRIETTGKESVYQIQQSEQIDHRRKAAMPTARNLGQQVFILHRGEQLPGIIRQRHQDQPGRSWVYAVELDGGEIVQVRSGHILRKQRVIIEELTPEELRRRCLEIQATWTPEERHRRWQGPKCDEWQPSVHKSGSRGGSLDYVE